ncbi:hypothetical protein ACH47X_23710 [Promicromonospora kroppenstedtii]|uniref:Uncharacterized protein n=1 Tax=Promicromonospora kroppenstedtii TaxID=440482 RepID=A0ABW7XQW7_9MICO
MERTLPGLLLGSGNTSLVANVEIALMQGSVALCLRGIKLEQSNLEATAFYAEERIIVSATATTWNAKPEPLVEVDEQIHPVGPTITHLGEPRTAVPVLDCRGASTPRRRWGASTPGEPSGPREWVCTERAVSHAGSDGRGSRRFEGMAPMTPAGPKDYIGRPGHLVFRFVFFVSSGNDVVRQRDLFEALVVEANHQFRLREDVERPFVLEVDRWEHDAPRRTTEMNEEFVRRARESHLTVVLLATEVRPGTREEIEAVLGEKDTQLAVVWMENPDERRKNQRLKKFLREHGEIAYDRTGPPGSDEATLSIASVVYAVLADITRGARREELFLEYR